MVKVPYFEISTGETLFIFFEFRGDFPFNVPYSFILQTSGGFLTDFDIDDFSLIIRRSNQSGSILPCFPSDYEYIENLLRSWGCGS